MNKKILFSSLAISILMVNTAYSAEINKDFNINENKNITQTIKELSPIEKIFNNKDSNVVNQVGYDIFNRDVFLSDNAKLSKNYKLNIGDVVDIYFWGDSVDLIAITGNGFLKSTNDINIDKEGNIFIPGVGLIQAKGRLISDVEKDITKILSSKFNNIHTKVTLADSVNFPVLITGNVKYRGTIYLNSNSSLIDALGLAGGVLKTGSLREIVYIDGKTKAKLTIDLYDILFNGNFKNIKLKEGDMIFVKPIGKVIALKEGVKTSGIYEFKDNETLRHLINYAGGLLPSIDQKAVQLESFDSRLGQRQIKDVPYKNLWYVKPADGDSIAFKNLYNTSENLVYVEGNIKHSGSFQYREGMKLSDIIVNKDELLSQTFADQAVIERLTGIGKDKAYIPISLTDFFNGYINPELKPQDKIKIYSSTTAETIEVSGYITNPAIISYQEGLSLRKLLGYVNFGDSTKFESINNKEVNNYNKIKTKNIVVEITGQNAVEESTEAKDLDKSEKKDLTVPEKENSDTNKILETNNKQINKTKIVYLYDLIVKNDLKYDLPIYAGDKVVFRLLQPNETVESVSVFGHVTSPGVYKHKDGMTLKEALQLANGIEKTGSLKGLVLLRPSIADEKAKNIDNSLIQIQEDIVKNVNTLQTLNSESSKTDLDSFLNSQKELLALVKEKSQKDYGRLMIEINADSINDIEEENNIELKPGDQIYIPYKSNYVIVLGEVLNNIAISYKLKRPAKYYIDKVGGYTNQAKKRGVFVIRENGSVKKLSNINKSYLEAGDTIVVPRKVGTPINWIEITKSIAQIAGNILSSVYILTKI